MISTCVIIGLLVSCTTTAQPRPSPDAAIAVFTRTHPPLTWPDPKPDGPTINIIGSRDNLYPLLNREQTTGLSYTPSYSRPYTYISPLQEVYGLDLMTSSFLTALPNHHAHQGADPMSPAPAPAPAPPPVHIVIPAAASAGTRLWPR